jgi:hypothetical protein
MLNHYYMYQGLKLVQGISHPSGEALFFSRNAQNCLATRLSRLLSERLITEHNRLFGVDVPSIYIPHSIIARDWCSYNYEPFSMLFYECGSVEPDKYIHDGINLDVIDLGHSEGRSIFLNLGDYMEMRNSEYYINLQKLIGNEAFLSNFFAAKSYIYNYCENALDQHALPGNFDWDLAFKLYFEGEGAYYADEVKRLKH